MSTRSQANARLAVRRSGVSVVDWAYELGVTRWAVHKLIAADPAMQEGPLMQRLQALIDALKSGSARWERLAGRHRGNHPQHRLIASQSFRPTSQLWHADFLHRQLVRGPPKVERPIQTIPDRAWEPFEPTNLWNPFKSGDG